MTDLKAAKPDPLRGIHDWMHKDGEPNPATNMDPQLIVLMDIALNIRRLVHLSEESMRMNQMILASMEEPSETDVN